ncbi:DUF692 domain-containing protein [Paraburkholderia panacisoli]|uniref:DUF692 domain-containing protein n=1 Tax=Paraburkholderia panacisoli TaxID=2603818 RepID=A0A5B0GNE2_9BURK|nr:DUF692 domain-containing protein [Paraburkholderia panacisoli]
MKFGARRLTRLALRQARRIASAGDRHAANVAWFDVHTENYMGGGRAPDYLDTIRRDSPVSLHGVGSAAGRPSGTSIFCGSG